MTLDEMKEWKRQLGYTYEQIAILSNVPLGTVQKVLGGVTRSPRYDTLCALEQLFLSKQDELEARRQEGASDDHKSRKDRKSKKEGERLSRPRRAEMIGGTIYEMASHSCLHHLVVCEIYASLHDYVCSHPGKGVVIPAPFEVVLDPEGKTVVQPDLFVLLDQEKVQGRKIEAVPELIVEVLSETSRRKDAYLKLTTYEEAGVQEYWIVDPINRKVMVYNFLQGSFPSVYSFEDQISPIIFGKDCKVDFSQIYERLRFLYKGERK